MTEDLRRLRTLKNKNVKFKTDSNRPAEVVYTSTFKSVVRYSDTTVYDQYYYKDIIDSDQHQIAEWIYALATSSGTTPRVSTSSMERITGKNGASISETSAQSKQTLNGILRHIQDTCGRDAKSLVESLVIYDTSIREWSKINHKSRVGKISLLKNSLDEAKNFRDNYLKR